MIAPPTSAPEKIPTTAAVAHASAGRPPFGFRRRGGRLEEDPDEADIVRTVLDAYDSGLTDDRIMSELKDAHGEWVREHWQPKEFPRHVGHSRTTGHSGGWYTVIFCDFGDLMQWKR